MPYVGLTLEIAEALRLLKLEESFVNSFYNTEPIDEYLKDWGSCLRFVYVDKGVCILGIPLEGEKDYWPPMLGIQASLRQILELAEKFRQEIKRLKIDLSEVSIAQMEAESIQMMYPDPQLILIP